MSKEASPLTFFEFTTAMAFLHFKLRQADIAVIETGMGGRFDATNVVVPEVSVITNINIEHTRYLGKGLKDIAREKAGIIKPGRPVITGEDKAAALSVIRGKAQESSSALYGLGRDFSSTGEPASKKKDFSVDATRQASAAAVQAVKKVNISLWTFCYKFLYNKF